MNHLARQKMAVLITGSASDYTLKTYGNYGDLIVRFLQLGDVPQFDVQKNEYPTFDPDVLLITGSAATVHENPTWVQVLKAYIVEQSKNGCAMFGICFGHQVIAAALGGETGVNPNGWELGWTHLNPNFSDPLLQIHRDRVVRAPLHFEVLAATSKCDIQILRGPHHLTIQGHPEFNEDIVGDLVQTRMNQGVIDHHLGTAALHTLNGKETSPFWRFFVHNHLIKFVKLRQEQSSCY